jgi:hypothetical protein
VVRSPFSLLSLPSVVSPLRRPRPRVCVAPSLTPSVSFSLVLPLCLFSTHAGAVLQPGAALLPRGCRGSGGLRRRGPRELREGEALGRRAAAERGPGAYPKTKTQFGCQRIVNEDKLPFEVAVPRLQQISFTLRVRVSPSGRHPFFLAMLSIDIPLIAGNIRFTSPAEFRCIIFSSTSLRARARARARGAPHAITFCTCIIRQDGDVSRGTELRSCVCRWRL